FSCTWPPHVMASPATAGLSIETAGRSASPSSFLRNRELLNRAIRFTNRVPMVAGPGKVGIRKRDPPVRPIPQDIPRRRLAIDPEEKPRLRIHVRVTPAIENDAGDVPARIESPGREHVGELLAECALVLGERRAEQLRAPPAALLGD